MIALNPQVHHQILEVQQSMKKNVLRYMYMHKQNQVECNDMGLSLSFVFQMLL